MRCLYYTWVRFPPRYSRSTALLTSSKITRTGIVEYREQGKIRLMRPPLHIRTYTHNTSYTALPLNILWFTLSNVCFPPFSSWLILSPLFFLTSPYRFSHLLPLPFSSFPSPFFLSPPLASPSLSFSSTLFPSPLDSLSSLSPFLLLISPALLLSPLRSSSLPSSLSLLLLYSPHLLCSDPLSSPLLSLLISSPNLCLPVLLFSSSPSLKTGDFLPGTGNASAINKAYYSLLTRWIM